MKAKEIKMTVKKVAVNIFGGSDYQMDVKEYFTGISLDEDFRGCNQAARQMEITMQQVADYCNEKGIKFHLAAFGNTYPIKEELKKIGFKWDGDHWKIDYSNDLELPEYDGVEYHIFRG